MTLTSIISYLIDRKNILYSVISCLIGLIVLFVGMLICDKSFWNYMFVWVLPGSGLVLLGTYSISMTDRHPIILIFPSIVFFSSLYIRYLVTYEYTIFLFLFLQTIPFFVFWLRIKKQTLYKEVKAAVFLALLSIGCLLISIIAVNFLDRWNVVSLPNYQMQQLEILVYIEIAMAGQYYAIGFLNSDLQLKSDLQ